MQERVSDLLQDAYVGALQGNAPSQRKVALVAEKGVGEVGAVVGLANAARQRGKGTQEAMAGEAALEVVSGVVHGCAWVAGDGRGCSLMLKCSFQTAHSVTPTFVMKRGRVVDAARCNNAIKENTSMTCQLHRACCTIIVTRIEVNGCNDAGEKHCKQCHTSKDLELALFRFHNLPSSFVPSRFVPPSFMPSRCV